MPKIFACFLLLSFAATITINAYQLNCRFENIDWNSVQYSCHALNYDAFCEDRNITAVTGAHTGLNTNDQVAMLWIHSMHSECVPRNVHLFFKNLKSLIVYNSTVSELHGDDLKGLTNLEGIAVGFNLIETIPANFFDYTPKLIRAHFQNNRIKHFEAKFLPQLAQLTQCNMGTNPCINVLAATPRELRELNGLLKIQCKPETRSITVINTIDNTCNNSTCTNVIYSYGGTGQGNDTIETRQAMLDGELFVAA